MRKAVLATLLVVSLVAAGCGGDDDDAEVDTGTQDDTSSETVALEADDFAFDPAEIDAEPGETLTIEIENVGDAPHTFTIDALDVDVEVPAGESAEVEVTVPDSGGADFYCRFHKGSGMVGTLGAAGGSGSGSGEETTTTTASDSGGGSPGDY